MEIPTTNVGPPGGRAAADGEWIEAREDLVRRISLLRRNAMAAPFERAFDEHAKMHEEASKYTRESAPEGVAEGGEVMAIHYREEEAIYIKASHDRVTVIFSTIFREETDRIFGKVFLQVRNNGAGSRVAGEPKPWFRNSSTLGGVPSRTPPRCSSGMNHP
jgi:actin related protein 2/3 complex, subunit 2